MKTKKTLLIFGLLIILCKCNNKNEVNETNGKSQRVVEDNRDAQLVSNDDENNRGSHLVEDLNNNYLPPQSEGTTQSEGTVKILESVDFEIPTVGTIKASNPIVSPGDAYLELVAKGSAKPPDLLLTDRVKNIDFDIIDRQSNHISSKLLDQPVQDAVHAYARYMNRPVPASRIASIKCLGVYESLDKFYIFFGYDSEPLEKYYYSYKVDKSNGHIFEYVNINR